MSTPSRLPYSDRRDSDKGIDALIGDAASNGRQQQFTTATDYINNENTSKSRLADYAPSIGQAFDDEGSEDDC